MFRRRSTSPNNPHWRTEKMAKLIPISTSDQDATVRRTSLFRNLTWAYTLDRAITLARLGIAHTPKFQFGGDPMGSAS